ncbi:MAG: DsbA family oxidoreductase [Pseudomonadota bacterium]
MNKPIEILITSDFICPWCFVAERRLKQAAADEGINIFMRFRPFELNPDMPKEGISRKTYRSSKFGSWERSMQLDQGTIEASADDPLVFNYKAIEYTPNTRMAHRLVWYVQQYAPRLEEAVADAIFESYFSQGIHIGDAHALAKIAHGLGLEARSVVEFLVGHEGENEVIAQENKAIHNEMHVVPYIRILDEELYGAQSASSMRSALRKAQAHQNQSATEMEDK